MDTKKIIAMVQNVDDVEEALEAPDKFWGVELANRPKNEKLDTLKDIKVFMQYIGFAGEHAVISNLMFRGLNATKSFIDEGADLIAMNEKRLFLVQVKTAFLDKQKAYSFNIGTDNEAINFKGEYDSVYVFVLTEDGASVNFLIFPKKEIEKQVEAGNIWLIKSTNRYRARFYLREGKVFLGNMKNEVSSFLNCWEIFEEKEGEAAVV